MVYLFAASYWYGRVHGRTREQNYIDDYRSINTEEQEIIQTTEKRQPEVYLQERTPNLKNYRLHNIMTRNRRCTSHTELQCGRGRPVCKDGCKLACVPSTELEQF